MNEDTPPARRDPDSAPTPAQDTPPRSKAVAADQPGPRHRIPYPDRGAPTPRARPAVPRPYGTNGLDRTPDERTLQAFTSTSYEK